jgi:hypothetical protein
MRKPHDQIAIDNLRFRVAEMVQKHNIPEFHNKLPCQHLSPCLDDVATFIDVWERSKYNPYLLNALKSPYLSARLVYKPVDKAYAIDVTARSWRTTGYSGYGTIDFYRRTLSERTTAWQPDDFIEFLHRLDPDWLTSIQAYYTPLEMRFGNFRREFFDAVVKRLPTIDWKNANPLDVARIRRMATERAQATITYQGGYTVEIPQPISEFAQKVLTALS